jgi:hypothetical protein
MLEREVLSHHLTGQQAFFERPHEHSLFGILAEGYERSPVLVALFTAFCPCVARTAHG